MMKSDLYTGQLKYKDKEFTFIFDGEELRLIASELNESERRSLFPGYLGRGISITGQTVKIEEGYLVGICNETLQTIVFLTKKGMDIVYRNEVLVVPILAYIIQKYRRETVDRISFSNAEINCIHPVSESFTVEYGPDIETYSRDGELKLITKKFSETTTEKQEFLLEDRRVVVYFGVSRGVSHKVGESPLSIDSSLIFEFDPTNDFEFVLEIWRIAKSFLQFLCYRKDVHLPVGDIYSPYEEEKHEKFATIYILGEDGAVDVDSLKRRRYIKQEYISGHEGEIFSDIINHKIYLRHLPDTYKVGHHIDAARFVMITAAFEWEFRRNYPNGIERGEKTKQIEQEATQAIQKLIDNSTGKLKDKYKFLKKLIKSDSLQSEVEQMGKDYGDIINPFGEYLYELNGQELSYSKMGLRLGNQRNHFAHGDIDEEFINESLIDVVFLETVLYAMQLRCYDIEKIDVQKAIKDLFHYSIAIR